MTSVMVAPYDFKSKDKVKNVSINLILNSSGNHASTVTPKTASSSQAPSFPQSPTASSSATSISTTSFASLVRIPPPIGDKKSREEKSLSHTHLSEYSLTNDALSKRKSEDASSMTSAGQKSPTTPPVLPPIDKSMFPRRYSHPEYEHQKQEEQTKQPVSLQGLLQQAQQQYIQPSLQPPLQHVSIQPSFYYPVQPSASATQLPIGMPASQHIQIPPQPLPTEENSHQVLSSQPSTSQLPTAPRVREPIEYPQATVPFTPGYYYSPVNSTTYYVTHPLAIPSGSVRYGSFPQINDLPTGEHVVPGSANFQGFPPQVINANQGYHPGMANTYAYSQHAFNSKDDFKHRTRRFRRRYNQVVRKYSCSFAGCTKSYGSLNHLNTHIVTKGHGQRKSKADFTSKEEITGNTEITEKGIEEINWNPNDPSGSPDGMNRQAQSVFMEPSGNYWYGIQPQPVYYLDQNKQPVLLQNPHPEQQPTLVLPGQSVAAQQAQQAQQSQIQIIAQAHPPPLGHGSGALPTISVSSEPNSVFGTYHSQAAPGASIPVAQQGYVLPPPHLLFPGTVVKPETPSDRPDSQKKSE